MFYLKKHYFDGIDEQGNAVIIYDATLKIFGLSIPYSSVIINRQQEETLELRTLSRIKRTTQGISHKRLHFSGKWTALMQAPPVSLFHQENRQLIWHCHSPKADFRFDFDGKYYRGLGYAETLEMNFPPWYLPIRELRWGRFLSENHSIIWIEWRGEQILQKLWWNGELIENLTIDDNRLFIKEKELLLNFLQPIKIKDEPLLSIAERFKFLRFLIDPVFLQTRETKWKSRAVLNVKEQCETGFALYETVLWKK